MRTGDTQGTTNPNIYVEIQTGTPEDVSSLVTKFHFDEQLYGGVYEIWLDNSDSALAAKDYKGYKVDLEIGFVGGSRSQYHDLWVDTQTMESLAGKLTMKLTCIDAWGLLARVNSSVGAQYWNYPELAPGEPDADADHYDKTVKQIVTAVVLTALDATFAIDDDDSETYFNSLKPPMSITNARTGIFQSMSMTGAYPLIQNDNDIHIIKPSDHASVYTFALGSNQMWEDSEESSVVIPNRVIFHGRDSDGNNLDSGDNGLDSTSYGRIGIYIDEHYYATRAEIELISDQTLLNNLAASTIAKIQGEASLGTLYAPIHCSLELLDKITITDTRYSGTKTITGYTHRIIRNYETNEGIYTIQVQLGGVATAYTPGRATPLQTKAEVEPPQPISGDPFTLAPAYLPVVLDLTFTAVDNDDVSWGAGTITTASGKVFTISSGSLNLANSNPYYLYYDTVLDDGTLDNTQTFTDTTTHERLLVAFLKKAPVANQKAMIVPANGGKAPLLNEDNISANCITASEIYVTSLSAISADMGLLTAGEIRVGTGTLGSNFTGWRMWVESSVGRIGGYNNDTIQWYSDTDGKLYAGAGAVVLSAAGEQITGEFLKFYDETSTYRGYIFGRKYVAGSYGALVLGGDSCPIDLITDTGHSINLRSGRDVVLTPGANYNVLFPRLKITQSIVSGSRALSTPYQAGAYPLNVVVSIVSTNDVATAYVEEGDSTPDTMVAYVANTSDIPAVLSLSFTVPPYAYYQVICSGDGSVGCWTEWAIGG